MWLKEIRGKEPYQNSNFPLFVLTFIHFIITCRSDSRIVTA